MFIICCCFVSNADAIGLINHNPFSFTIKSFKFLDFHFSCAKAAKKYSCPRCNIEYCSVGCYQSPHHIECSEEFYKDCVTQEMELQKQMRSGTLDDIPGLSDDVKQMYQMLKRMESTQSMNSDFTISEEEEELDSDDDENPKEDGELSKRLEGIDLNDADAVWSKLNENEREEFGKIIKGEEVTSILPVYNPWWENKVQRVLISEVNDDQSSETAIEHRRADVDYPKIVENIADFSQISNKPPAPCVPFNLVNVLAAYISTVRFFYGDHMSSSHDAVNYLMMICANLKANANFDDTSLAIESIRQEAHCQGFSIDEDDVQQMKKDVDYIHEGPDSNKHTNLYVLAALSDLYHLLNIAKHQRYPAQKKSGTSQQKLQITPSKEHVKEFEKFVQRFGDHKIVEFQSLDRRQVTASLKKIEYYLAYVKKFL